MIKIIQQMNESDKKYFLRPIINRLSLTATANGLFFASGGDDSGAYASYSEYGFLKGGEPVPALLYITWDDINAWLARSAQK